MTKTIITAVLVTLFASGAAIAQTTAPKAPATPGTGTATSMDPAAETKFKAADKDGNGMLSSTEASAYKSDMGKIDTNKDGNVSRDEFASAVKSGVIK